MATNHIRFDVNVPAHFKNSYNGSLLTVGMTKVTGPFGFLAYVYQCHLNEDNDGAPTAYGWNRPGSALQQGLNPIENRPTQQAGLANAASPWQNLWNNHNFSWVGVYSATPAFAHAQGLLIDDRPELESRIPASGQAPVNPHQPGYFPVVQQAGAPAPGYYVSQANFLADDSLQDWDQRKYVDASEIPYAVYADRWAGLGVNRGDYGLAIRTGTGANCGFFFGDTGTVNRVGECSRKLVRTLSATGYNEDEVTFFVFPNTSSSSGALSLIKPRVKVEIAKLDYAPNVSVLCDHFSSSHSDNIMSALVAWGYRSKLIDI